MALRRENNADTVRCGGDTGTVFRARGTQRADAPRGSARHIRLAHGGIGNGTLRKSIAITP